MRLETPDRHCWDDLIGEHERIAYQGYCGERQIRGRRALLLIDLYNRAFGEREEPLREAVRSTPSSCGPAGWRALPVLEELLARARRAHLPVIFTVSGPKSAAWGASTLRSTGDPGAADWGNQIVAPLAPRPDELVLAKARASVFFGTPLDAYLRRIGVEALVVAGETTSGCVRASVVDAYSLGFDVAVVEEGVFDRSPVSHKVNLFDMHCKYATVVPAATGYRLVSEPGAAVLNV